MGYPRWGEEPPDVPDRRSASARPGAPVEQWDADRSGVPPRPEAAGRTAAHLWRDPDGTPNSAAAWSAGDSAEPALTPETGQWSSRQDRWIPQQRGVEPPDFAITRFDDTGELVRTPPGHGRVLDHDDWYEAEPGQPGWGYPEPRPVGDVDPGWDQRPDDPRDVDPDHPPGEGDRWSEPAPWAEPEPRAESSPWRDRPSWGDRPPGHGRSRPAGREHRPGWDEPPPAAGGRDLELHRPRDRSSGREIERLPPQAEDWDTDEDDRRGFIAVSVATLCWYAVPAGLYALWTLLLDAKARPGCIDPTGAPCRSPRTEALSALLDSLPQLAVALVFSTVVALLIRWYTTGWRAVTVGFAGAVVGAGAATVLFSVLGSGAG